MSSETKDRSIDKVFDSQFGKEKIHDHWQWIETGDGSPSLRLSDGSIEESMHHSGGAFAETRYIYEPLLRAGKTLVSKGSERGPVILSVGLGLGYNEIFTAFVYPDSDDISPRLFSFESDPWLREEFAGWVEGDDHGLLYPCFEKICSYLDEEMKPLFQPGTHEDNASGLIRERLRQWSERGEWELHGRLTSAEQIPEGCELFLWDAFSRKTSPDLWDEEFLKACFARGAETAGLATYASQGNLKRALAASGFRLETRTGFQGKRSATWAARGLFPAAP